MVKKKSTNPGTDDRSDLQQFSRDVAHALGDGASPTKIRSSLLYRVAKAIVKEMSDLGMAGEYRGAQTWPWNLTLLVQGGGVTFKVRLQEDTIRVECEEWRAQVGSGEYVRIPGLLRSFLAGRVVTGEDRVALEFGREAVSAARARNFSGFLRAVGRATDRLFTESRHQAFASAGSTEDPELKAMLDKIIRTQAYP